MKGNINAREVEILRTLPPNEVIDFIEKNGERLRSLIEDHEEMRNEEIMEALREGYGGV